MSPYGVPNETKEQTQWIEKCVNSITGNNKRTGKPYTKGEKIAICKVQLKKTGTSEEAISEESLRQQFNDFEDRVWKALSPELRPDICCSPGGNHYIVDIFETYVIVAEGDKMYKLPYNMSGEEVTFDWSNATEVERVTSYEPVQQAEIPMKVPQIPCRDGGRVRTFGGRTLS
uniref:Uncharacterized protein n=1 Tax=viral metagenome TaxID=1070528 RepID=A0A6M3LBH8_9ZZZZ